MKWALLLLLLAACESWDAKAADIDCRNWVSKCAQNSRDSVATCAFKARQLGVCK